MRHASATRPKAHCYTSQFTHSSKTTWKSQVLLSLISRKWMVLFSLSFQDVQTSLKISVELIIFPAAVHTCNSSHVAADTCVIRWCLSLSCFSSSYSCWPLGDWSLCGTDRSSSSQCQPGHICIFPWIYQWGIILFFLPIAIATT